MVWSFQPCCSAMSSKSGAVSVSSAMGAPSWVVMGTSSVDPDAIGVGEAVESGEHRVEVLEVFDGGELVSELLDLGVEGVAGVFDVGRVPGAGADRRGDLLPSLLRALGVVAGREQVLDLELALPRGHEGLLGQSVGSRSPAIAGRGVRHPQQAGS